jgi:uncharacterized protein YecT (DUF1311 family)
MFSSAALIAAIALAGPCDDANTTRELERCYTRAFAHADSLLAFREAAFQRLLVTPAGREHFRASGRAFRSYRERECRAQAEIHEGGSMGPVVYVSCKLTLTEARREFLEDSTTE